MNSTPTTHREVELAQSDWAIIGLSTRYARQNYQAQTDTKEPWQTTVVDGSGLSPSWRRLKGGETVWDEELDQEIYIEELDRLVDGFNASDSSEVCLRWDDGMLVLEYDPEA